MLHFMFVVHMITCGWKKLNSLSLFLFVSHSTNTKISFVLIFNKYGCNMDKIANLKGFRIDLGLIGYGIGAGKGITLGL